MEKPNQRVQYKIRDYVLMLDNQTGTKDSNPEPQNTACSCQNQSVQKHTSAQKHCISE